MDGYNLLFPQLNNLNMLSISAGTGVGRGKVLKYKQYCLTLGLSRELNGVTLSYCY